MKAQAAICYQAHSPLTIEDVTLRDNLNPNEVLVRLVASGICHTDLLVRDAPQDGPFMPKPAIAGHEGAGVVERVGSAVTGLSPGDSVIMSYAYDGSCPSCKANLNPYCDNYMQLNLVGTDTAGTHTHTTIQGPASVMHQQASFSTYTITTDNNLHRVPENLPLKALGPVGCGFMTGTGAVLNVLRPEPGSSLIVFGLGAVGLAALCAAKKSRCDTIIGVDLHQNRRELARELGATHVIDPGKGDTIEQLMAEFPDGVNYAFEATGIPAVMSQAIDALAVNGHCVLVGGVPDPEAKAEFRPFNLLMNRHIQGARMGHTDPQKTVGAVLEMVADGTLPIEKLITYYDFADINKAIEDSEKGDVIKPVVVMPE